MTYPTYTPSADGSQLEIAGTDQVIRPTPGLLFGDNDKMLSLLNTGINGAVTTSELYEAVRLTRPMRLQDVEWTPNYFFRDDPAAHPWLRTVSNSAVILPPGSLLLREIAAAGGGRPWCALSPNQQGSGKQNIQRLVRAPAQDDVYPVLHHVLLSAGSVDHVLNTALAFITSSTKRGVDELCRAAHEADVRLTQSMGLISLNYSYPECEKAYDRRQPLISRKAFEQAYADELRAMGYQRPQVAQQHAAPGF